MGYRHVGQSRERRRLHDISDRHAAQGLAHCRAGGGLLGSIEQEPANEREPEAAQIEVGSEKRLVEPKDDKAISDKLSDIPRDTSGSLEVLIDGPDDSTKHAPTVKGEAWDHV